MTGAEEIQEVIARQPTELDRFWLDTAQGMTKESVGALEDAAKQLIGIASLLQGLYFAAVSFSDIKKVLVVQDTQSWLTILLFISPIIPWLASVVWLSKFSSQRPTTPTYNLQIWQKRCIIRLSLISKSIFNMPIGPC
jgi:hypothetical protein